MIKIQGYSEQKDKEYVNKMTDLLSKIRKEIKPKTVIQCESTNKCLNRPKDKDEEWNNRPIPESYLANPQAKSVWDLVGFRPITPQEVVIYESHRRNVKSTIGQSEESSISEEKKEKAINSFMYHPGLSLIEKDQKITGLTSIKSKEPIVEQKKESLISKWLNKFFKKSKPQNHSLIEFWDKYGYVPDMFQDVVKDIKDKQNK